MMNTFLPAQSAAPAGSDLRAWSEQRLIAAAKSGTTSSFWRALRTAYETSLPCDSPDHAKP